MKIDHVQLDFDDNVTVIKVINKAGLKEPIDALLGLDEDDNKIIEPVRLNEGHFNNPATLASKHNIYPVVRAAIPADKIKTGTNIAVDQTVTITDGKVNEALTLVDKPPKTEEQLAVELESYKKECIEINRTVAAEKISALFGGKTGDDLLIIQLNAMTEYMDHITQGHTLGSNQDMQDLYDLNAKKDAIRTAENEAAAAINDEGVVDIAGVDAVKDPDWPAE